jgi:hypothetical protein
MYIVCLVRHVVVCELMESIHITSRVCGCDATGDKTAPHHHQPTDEVVVMQGNIDQGRACPRQLFDQQLQAPETSFISGEINGPPTE